EEPWGSALQAPATATSRCQSWTDPPCLLHREPGREEPPLAHVIGEAECSAVLGGRLRPPPEPAEEIGARGGQEMIAAQRRGLDTVECSEAGRRSVRQADRYRSVQFDHRRWRDVGELPVKVDDPRPVRRLPR